MYEAGTDELDGRQLYQENLLKNRGSHTHSALTLTHIHSRRETIQTHEGK